MARCKVEQVRCDRCKRVETVAVLDEEVTNPGPAFIIEMKGTAVIKYDDLCEKCKAAILNSIEDIKEWDREVKQQFGPTLGNNEAPPLAVAPTYSPPKPHSASSKR